MVKPDILKTPELLAPAILRYIDALASPNRVAEDN